MAFWNGIFGRQGEKLGAPVSGEAIPLKEVKDEAFSSGMLGEGLAIIPDGARLVAPCMGMVDVLMETGHSVTLKTNGGAQVLMHIGLDTVKLGGKHFGVRCAAGQKVQRGQTLIEFDREAIEKDGYDPVVVMVMPDGANIAKTVTGRQVAEGETVICLAAH